MLTRSEYEAYRSRLKNVENESIKDLKRLWGTLDLSKPDKVRDTLIEELPDVVATRGDETAVEALLLYERLRVNGGYNTPFETRMPPHMKFEELSDGVREHLNPLFASGNAAKAAKQIQEMLAKYVLRQAGNAIWLNAQNDTVPVKCASIPSPGCTCKFCLSFAAMGFVFDKRKGSKKGNGVWHDNCRCQLIPGFGNHPSLDWYSPERYQKLLDYLNEGTISLQRGAAPLEKELDVGIWLADAGHVVRFLKASNKFKDRRPDTLVDGVFFEIKVPEGNRKDNTISDNNAWNQFKGAVGQSDKLIISHHKIADLISYDSYRVQTIFAAQDWPQFTQVLLISGSGRIEEIR